MTNINYRPTDISLNLIYKIKNFIYGSRNPFNKGLNLNQIEHLIYLEDIDTFITWIPKNACSTIKNSCKNSSMRCFFSKQTLKFYSESSNKIIFLREYINNQSKDKVNFILLGDINEKEIQKFKEILLNQINKKIMISSNMEDIKDKTKISTNFILGSLGNFSFNQIKLIKNYEELFDIDFPNLLLLEQT